MLYKRYIIFLYKICGLTLEDHAKNDGIREIMETEVTLTDTVEAKQLKRYGHMKRMKEDRLPKKIYEWTPIERKKRRRPRSTWKKKAKQAMDGRNLREEHYMDRNRWRLGCEIGRKICKNPPVIYIKFVQNVFLSDKH
jgi:hypothetical protein